jgi:hypothetical protein
MGAGIATQAVNWTAPGHHVLVQGTKAWDWMGRKAQGPFDRLPLLLSLRLVFLQTFPLGTCYLEHQTTHRCGIIVVSSPAVSPSLSHSGPLARICPAVALGSSACIGCEPEFSSSGCRVVLIATICSSVQVPFQFLSAVSGRSARSILQLPWHIGRK